MHPDCTGTGLQPAGGAGIGSPIEARGDRVLSQGSGRVRGSRSLIVLDRRIGAVRQQDLHHVKRERLIVRQPPQEGGAVRSEVAGARRFLREYLAQSIDLALRGE